MAVARPRLLTLAHGEMETLRMVRLLPFRFYVAHLQILTSHSPASKYLHRMQINIITNAHIYRIFQELIHIAQEWTKPGPSGLFNLRVPVEYASIHAAVRYFLPLSQVFLTYLFLAIGRWPIHLCKVARLYSSQ